MKSDLFAKDGPLRSRAVRSMVERWGEVPRDKPLDCPQCGNAAESRHIKTSNSHSVSCVAKCCTKDLHVQRNNLEAAIYSWNAIAMAMKTGGLGVHRSHFRYR